MLDKRCKMIEMLLDLGGAIIAASTDADIVTGRIHMVRTIDTLCCTPVIPVFGG